MQKLTNILIHPAIVALFIALIFIWITPPFFQKYRIDLLNFQTTNVDDQQRKYFHDFNHDGESEGLLWGMNSFSKVPYIDFLNHENLVVKEWNCPGEWVKDSPVIFGDYDHNGKDEVYGFTYLNDSIFLNGVEPYGNWNFEIKKKFICKVKKYNDNHVWAIFNGKVTDLNGDNYGEIVFPLNAGYALQPRAVFAYDIFNDTVFRTPFFGAALADISFVDIDNDSLDEVIVNTTSPANYKEDVPYSDTCNWVILLDNDLSFYFEPIGFAGPFGGILNKIIYRDGEPVVFSNHKINSAIAKTNDLFLFDLKGKLITNKKPEYYFGSTPEMANPSNKPTELIYVFEKSVYQVDANLNIKKKKTTKYNIKGKSWPIDLNNDVTAEYLFSTSDASKMVIYRSDFSHPVILDQSPYIYQTVSVKHSLENPVQICINGANSTSIYEYKENPYYYFKYPSYLLLYLLLFGFFYVLFLFQKQRIKKIYEAERRLNELQMLTIRNQMNPHFTFNSINSISSVIYKEDKKTAYNFFTKFSDLIRFTLKNAEKISVPLSDEIDFVKNYLELEKFRFKEKFDYLIDVDGSVDLKIQVPRMIIQTFAENAVKHGLSHLEKEGFLKIQISQPDHTIKLTIEDNGIGREATGKLDIQGTGKGMMIIDQIFDLYYKLKGKKITHSIIDLKDNNNQPLGTRVFVEMEI